MGVINLGSINIDHVYSVDYFLQRGETKACKEYTRGLGGKGINQSIALHRAGTDVCHVGAIGIGDTWTRQAIISAGIDLQHIHEIDTDTGHAIIQLETYSGDNNILLYPGANHVLAIHWLQAALDQHPDKNWVLLQNETNLTELSIVVASDAKRKIAINPAPCTPDLLHMRLLEMVDLLIVNEVELQQLAEEMEFEVALTKLRQQNTRRIVLVTLGNKGMYAAHGDNLFFQAAIPTSVVDTTAAGDTVTGYFLTALDEGKTLQDALSLAAHAASITVSRAGAANSIPYRNELARPGR